MVIIAPNLKGRKARLDKVLATFAETDRKLRALEKQINDIHHHINYIVDELGVQKEPENSADALTLAVIAMEWVIHWMNQEAPVNKKGEPDFRGMNKIVKAYEIILDAAPDEAIK